MSKHSSSSSSSGRSTKRPSSLLPGGAVGPASGPPRTAFVDVPAAAYGPHEMWMRQRFRAALWWALLLELAIAGWGGGGFELLRAYGGVGWPVLVHAALAALAALALLNILVVGAGMPAHVYTLYGTRAANPVRAVAAGSQSLAVALTIAYAHMWIAVPVLFLVNLVYLVTAPTERPIQGVAAGADFLVLGALMLVRYLEYERAARRTTVAAYRRITSTTPR